MFSSVGPATTARNGPNGPAKTYGMQMPRGFSVRIFKGPTTSSFPYSATAKFDVGYRPTTNSDSRQNQNWYSRPEPNVKSYPAPRDQPQPPRFPTNNPPTDRRGYEPNRPGTSSSYSIYAGTSKDTYVYERSLSSKSDIYSSSEYDTASTTTFSPSSFLSPALSTDSTTTLKSPAFPERALHTSRPRTPSSSMPNPFPIQTPALIQAQSSVRGSFYNPAQESAPPRPNTSFGSYAPPSRPSSLPALGEGNQFRSEVGVQGRSSVPIPLSTSSAGSSDIRNSGVSYSSSTLRVLSEHHEFTQGTGQDSDGESLLDAATHLAQMNAEYNSLSSSSYYPTTTDSSDQQEYHPAPVAPESHAPDLHTAPLAHEVLYDTGTQQQYSNYPLRSSPEQQEFFSNSQNRNDSNNDATGNVFEYQSSSSSFPSFYQTRSNPDDRSSSQSDSFIPPLAHLDSNPTARGDVSTSTFLSEPQTSQSSGQNRAVPEPREPFSFTISQSQTTATQYTIPSAMTSYLSSGSDSSDRPLPVPPPIPMNTRPYDGYNLLPIPTQDGDPNGRDQPSLPRGLDYRRTRRESESRLSSSPSDSRSAGSNADYPSVSAVSYNTIRREPHTEQDRPLPVPPPIPLESRPSVGYNPQIPGAQNDARRRDDRSPSTSPPSAGYTQSMAGAQNEARRRDERSPSASPPSDGQEHLRTRKDSIAVESSRTRRRRERPPSVSPPLEGQGTRRDSTAVEPPRRRVEYQPIPSGSYYPTDGGQNRNTVPVPPTEARHQQDALLDTNTTRTWNPPFNQFAGQSISPPREPPASAPHTGSGRGMYDGSVPASSGALPYSVIPERVSSTPPTQLPVQTTAQQPRFAPSNSLTQRGYSDPDPTRSAQTTSVEGFSNPTTLQPPPLPSRDRSNDPSYSQQLSRPLVPSAEPQRSSPDRYTSQDPITLQRSAPQGRVANPPSNRSAAAPGPTPPNQELPGVQQTPSSRLSFVEPYRRNSDGDRPANNAPILQRSSTPFGRTPNPPPSQSGPPNPDSSGTSLIPPSAPPEPRRRHSDGEQIPQQITTLGDSIGITSITRSRVRWTENLICPSPIFSSQRRKGWYNRRGDQLWTNEGAYKPPQPGQEYPVDLDGYPEYGQGWMNEEGVRIDMRHRLIPKPPLRSVLKPPRARGQSQEVATST